MTPLLILLLAAVVEVYIHGRRYTVTHPKEELDEPFYTSCQEPQVNAPRENAALVMLARNSELAMALQTVQSIEKHFNQWFHYPIVFLNDEPWSEEFMYAMNATVSGQTRFEVLPKDAWTFPSWMDPTEARASMARQGKEGIIYAGLETYHHMCRFYSGKFYTLKALEQYEWYWRIEPDVDFHCSLTYDPFVEMAKHKKVYGYTIALAEEPATCPNLFRQISDWKEKNKIPDTELWRATVTASWVPWPFRSMMSWFGQRDRNGDKWSLCHYWSNFEIASLDFFRGKEYQDLYETLEKAGGFYYERVSFSLSLSPLPDSSQSLYIDTHIYMCVYLYVNHCPLAAMPPWRELYGCENPFTKRTWCSLVGRRGCSRTRHRNACPTRAGASL